MGFFGFGFVGGPSRCDEDLGGNGGGDSDEGFIGGVVVMVVLYSPESLQDSATVPILSGLSILTLGLCFNTMP